MVSLTARPDQSSECLGCGRPISPSDELSTLICRFVNNKDKAAFASLIDATLPIIQKRIRRMLPGCRQATLDDLTQDVLLKAIRSAHSFNCWQPAIPWLYSIVFSQVVEHWRRLKRSRLVFVTFESRNSSEDQAGWSSVLEPVSREVSPPDRATLKEYDQIVRSSIQALPEPLHTAYVLFHEQGRTYEQIAIAMNIPIGTVGTYIRQAKRRLPCP